MRVIALTSVAVLVAAGCSEVRVVNTGDPWTDPATSTTAAPALPPTNPMHLANAFDYAAHPTDQTAYYFTSPSGRWQCAILPRNMAGCQSSGGALGIAGAPVTVPDATGTDSKPNAVVVEPDGDAKFAVLDQPGLSLSPGPATVLPFNRTLIAARFRCNIQEATGLSCLSEQSGNGFTFNEDGFAPQYTEVPVDAP
jgi:hypothetical protein